MKKRIFALSLLTVLLSVVLFSGSVACAAGLDLKLETHTYWQDAPYGYTVFTENLPDNAKLVSIKSSKPSVLTADKWGSGCFDAVVSPHKPGRSRVTVKYRIGKKTYTVSGVYTVRKYPNAIKKLVFNGKTVNFKKDPFNADYKSLKAKKVTIKVTPAKGWKLVQPIEILSEGSSYKTVRNGKTVKISLKQPRVDALITLTNSKGEEFEYFIDITE